MKTAMKKLFSLVLVAVLLVGAMPFQAFADEVLWLVVHVDGEQKATGKNTTDFATDEQILSEANRLYPGVFPEKYTYVIDNNGVGADIYLTTVTAPVVCGNCGGEHATEECTKTYCEKCGTWTDHNATAHCGECGELVCVCCDECGKKDCICCDTCNKYPCVCTATVEILAKASNAQNYTSGPSFVMKAGTHSAADVMDAANYNGGTVLSFSVTDVNGGNKVVRDETINMSANGKYLLWLELAPTDTTPEPTPAPATVEILVKVDDVDGYTSAGTFEISAGSKTAQAIYNAANYSANTVLSFAVTDKNGGNKVVREEAIDLVSGAEYILWLEVAPAATTPDTDPTTCTCGAALLNGMCTGCYLDMGDCVCDATTTPDAPKNPVTVILNYNYRGAPRNGSVTVNKGDLLADVIASIPAPNRDGHLFSHWTMDADGDDLINNERATGKSVTIYAQWDDDLAIGGHITIRVHLYKNQWADELENIKKGAKMGDVLDYVDTPTRPGFKFMGWYWDDDYDHPVESNDKVYKNSTIYAKWDRRLNTNEMMLKIYVNGNTKSVAKVVDLYDYSRDGLITYKEVSKIVNKYYTAASSSDDMDIDGLFTTKTWNNGKYSMRNADKTIDVEDDVETIVYVMVRNAKKVSSGSSAAADSSNPKTGDMIFNAVSVMGASAACLATLIYLNKKRAY